MSAMPMTRKEFKSMVGEGVHTGLRKAAESKESHEAWQAIRDMPDWSAVTEFVAWGFETTYGSGKDEDFWADEEP